MTKSGPDALALYTLRAPVRLPAREAGARSGVANGHVPVRGRGPCADAEAPARSGLPSRACREVRARFLSAPPPAGARARARAPGTWPAQVRRATSPPPVTGTTARRRQVRKPAGASRGGLRGQPEGQGRPEATGTAVGGAGPGASGARRATWVRPKPRAGPESGRRGGKGRREGEPSIGAHGRGDQRSHGGRAASPVGRAAGLGPGASERGNRV